MAYDETEDPEELLQFYDFGPLEEEAERMTMNGTELVLDNGMRLGHRHHLKLFKQRLPKEVRFVFIGITVGPTTTISYL